jgi:hypothetical protein
MYRHLAAVKGDQPFELEMSVDETETVTTLAGAHLHRTRAGSGLV